MEKRLIAVSWVIRFLFVVEKSCIDVKEDLNAYGDSSPSMTTVKIDLTSFNVAERYARYLHGRHNKIPRVRMKY